MKGVAPFLFLGVLAALIGGFVLSSSAYAQDDELESLFDNGVNLYKRGKLQESLQVFQNVLAQNPSHEMAFIFWNKAGNQKIILEMLLQKGEYESAAKRLIEMATVGRKDKQEDSARIQELVNLIVTGGQVERTEALLILVADHGEYAVEHMYKEMASDDIEARVNIITSLARLGDQAVLPLIQVLNCEDATIRRSAAGVLGRIRDLRAVPALKKMASSDDSNEAKQVAAISIERITGKDVNSLPSAAELFTKHAADYINKVDSIIRPFEVSRVIWKWRNNELIKSPVYSGLFGLELAEECCYQALSCQPGNKKAIALLAVAYAAQRAEAKATRVAAEDDEDSLPETLTNAQDSLVTASRLVALAGIDGLNEALNFTLQGDHILTSVELINIIAEARANVPALDQALKSESKLVSYTAATALASLGVHTAEVVKTLVSAFQESAIQEILVIDNQPNSRNALVNDLKAAGYFATAAENGTEGFERAMSFPKKDLVILRVGLDDITTDKVVFSLGSNLPVMLLCSDEEMTKVKGMWTGKVAGFISSPTAADVYMPEVKSIIGEAMTEEKERAMVLSAGAGCCLLCVDKSFLTPYMDDMVAVLGKPDNVRIHALNVLANIGYPAGLEKIKEVLGDDGASLDCRVAAAYALGAIFEKTEGAVDAEALDLLIAAMGSDEVKLSSGAGAAVGKAAELPEGLKDKALNDYRID